MWISYYFVLFCIYSCMGWVFETIYCTIDTKKWANRGFLYGPVCPIYGCGAVAVTVLFQALDQNQANSMTWWQVYLVSVIGSAVLEFVTSVVLEKMFHASWWDYSHLPFNIQGRVCLRNSLLFGVAGLVIVYVILPVVSTWIRPVSAIAVEGISLVLMALLAVDCTLTVCALTNLDEAIKASEENLNLHMEQFVSSLEERRQDIGTRIAEEKLQFSRQHAEKTVQRFNYANRSALKRVVKFRDSKHEKSSEQREIFLEALKRYKR
ncbi:MAG: putative ABC transporter permease [Eubacteriales bacterium]|nr:putative ABC transporter permease [Eubacteriales bacterium]